jgi:hypothetical protein
MPSALWSSLATAEIPAGRSRECLNFSYCKNGHYCGLVPVKLPSRRLLWDAHEVDALLAGRAVKTPDAADLDKHFERKTADASKRPAHIVRKAEEAKTKRMAALTASEVVQ